MQIPKLYVRAKKTGFSNRIRPYVFDYAAGPVLRSMMRSALYPVLESPTLNESTDESTDCPLRLLVPRLTLTLTGPVF